MSTQDLTTLSSTIDNLNKVLFLYKMALTSYGNSAAQKDDLGVKCFGNILTVIGDIYYRYLDELLKNTKIVMVLDNEGTIVLDNCVNPAGLSIMAFKESISDIKCPSRSIHILAIEEFKLGEN